MNFSIYFMGYDITSLVTFIVGAMITAIISYIFSYRREIKFLKYRIQIDTAEELLELVKEYFDCSAKSKLYNDLGIKQYNLAFDAETKKTDVSLSLIDIFSKNISQTFTDGDICFNSFTKSFFAITNYLELRRIVLKQIFNCQSELLDQYRALFKKKNELRYTQSKIIMVSSCHNYIDNSILDEYNSSLTEYRELIYDLDGLIDDLQRGLQNKYYRKIFLSKKIPERRPIDPSIKTLKL